MSLESLRELSLEKKGLGLWLQNHSEYLMKIKPVGGLLDKFEENPLFQLKECLSGSSLGLSDHIDVLKVKSRTHLMAEEDERNEEAYIME